jgi:carboxyl-terminal processing protease
MFLDGGTVLTQVDREGNETVYEAGPGGEGADLAIAILVSAGSASGSEVLAGALRDHGRATLIGEQTFGKGSVNHLRELSNGGALYVTIARWLTPNGDLIEGVGLTPDTLIDTSNGEDPRLRSPLCRHRRARGRAGGSGYSVVMSTSPLLPGGDSWPKRP